MPDYVQLNNWHPHHLALTRLERNCYIIRQDFKEIKRRFHVRGVKYTKELHVTRPYKVAETHVGQIQEDCVFGLLRDEKTIKFKIIRMSGIWLDISL